MAEPTRKYTIRQKELIKVRGTGKNGEFKIVHTVINPVGKETNYTKIRIGNTWHEVTINQAMHIKRYAQEVNMRAKFGEIDREQLKRLKSNLVNEYDYISRSSILFENITKQTGIDALFKRRLDLSPEQQKLLKKFTKNIKELQKDQYRSHVFYKEYSMYFQDITSFYRQMKEQGGVLTSEDIEDLMSSVKAINEMAEKWLKKRRTNLNGLRLILKLQLKRI